MSQAPVLGLRNGEAHAATYTNGDNGYDRSGGKAVRVKRQNSRAATPYSRPASGRHAAAGYAAAAELSRSANVNGSVPLANGEGSSDTPKTTSSSWLGSVSGAISGLLGWPWGKSPNKTAGRSLNGTLNTKQQHCSTLSWFSCQIWS